MSSETPRVALVTGAARRIGAAIARDLAIAGGWTVAIHYGRSGDDAEALAAEIEAGGGRAATFACDLMSEAATAALVGRVAERFGSVTCLVNNASVFERDAPDTATCESWARHMQVNLRAPFVLIQSLARQLPAGLPAGRTSCVINLLDQRVWNLTPHFTSYTVSKMGLWTLTRTLAMALAPRIRVNAVGPGPTLPSARQTAEQFARQWSSQPLAHPVDPEEICAAVRFLLDAPSVTGQMIAVDAGQHLGWPRAPSAKSADE
jgi:NAD(P)-dependent dehydrogenase (short-subunit alcohol dehydrogenase family)